jgi:hypothetical protein
VSTAEKYVVAAYLVFLVALLVYLLIHSLRLAQLERQLAELSELAHPREQPGEPPRTAAVG